MVEKIKSEPKKSLEEMKAIHAGWSHQIVSHSKTLTEFNEASEIQNAYLDTFTKNQQYLMSEDARWVDKLLSLATTLATVSTTVLIASLSLKSDEGFFHSKYLVGYSFAALILSTVAVFALILYRRKLVLKYKTLIDWAHDKMANVLNISHSKAMLAKMNRDIDEIGSEIDQLTKEIKR